MVISRCCFAEDGTDFFISACRTNSTLIFLQRIKFSIMSFPFSSLMLQLSNRKFKQPLRLRLIKRHLKVNICAKDTFLRLLLFTRTVSLTNYPKKRSGGAPFSKWCTVMYFVYRRIFYESRVPVFYYVT